LKNPSLQTRHAIQAHELADAVNAGLSKISLPPVGYVPSLTAPEGPSTGGGVQSLQHLRLTAPGGEHADIVAGTANQVAGTAELRSFEYVDMVFRGRFRKPVPIDPSAYRQFLDMTRSLLELMRLRTTIIDAPPELVSDLVAKSTMPPAAAPAPSKTLWIAVGVGVAVLAALGALALR
jgi:hypothetical protein